MNNSLNRILTIVAILIGFSACGKSVNTGYSSTGGNNTGGPDTPTPVQETALAFPGAEGFGRNATGGRGGKIIEVTNLNDAGTGSFRAAITASGARIVIFKVSGRIDLKSALAITNGNLTVAGQTAPGDGICISGYPIELKADNVIIRFMRFRLGNGNVSDANADGYDTFWGRDHQNIIIDHCSMSWSIDEVASFYGNKNFTMQWCTIAESLRNAGHSKGSHGYGGIWGGQKVTFHHNLIADNDSRNPRFCGSRYSSQPDLERVDFRNNVIFNWGANSGYAGEGGQYNMVNNYYKPGPNSSNPKRIFQPNPDDGTNSQPKGAYGQFYVVGNYMNNASDVTNDNWLGININNNVSGITLTQAMIKLTTPWDTTGGGVYTHTAADAYEKVLTYAGASYVRDAVDTRIIGNVRSGTPQVTGTVSLTDLTPYRLGIIDNQASVGGWPAYNSTATPVCTAGDGIPDDWKKAHKLDVSKNVANGRNLSTGYDNIEVYINSLVKDITDAQK